MVSSDQFIAGITTLLAATFAIYAYNVSTPSSDLVTDSDSKFCSDDNSKCGQHSSNNGNNPSETNSLYDLNYTNIDGVTESMGKYRGHVLLIVNVASKCGLTPVNYEQLTELYEKYSESEGLRILAFPSNQFMGQEPIGEKEIKEFAATYNAHYDMSAKVDVNGANTHPVWNYLKSQQPGFIGDFVKWNLSKFLVDKKGNVVKRYSPTTSPKELEQNLLEYFKQAA